MYTKNLQELLKRHKTGDLTREEMLYLNQWYTEIGEAADLFLENGEVERNVDDTWLLIDRDTNPTRQVQSTKNRTRFAIAAVIIFVFLSAGFILFKMQRNRGAQNINYTSDVSPGRNNATLTLADGKKINLSDAKKGKVAEEDAVTITKSSDGNLVYTSTDQHADKVQLNTLTTARGETYKLHLPDGSEVWLNSASSLTYSTKLQDKGKRIVTLTGEAYFQVAKDKMHAFVVKTDKQEVEVLGTHFNINSYADESAVKTTLLEGSVRVTAGNQMKTLVPGQEATNYGTVIKLAEANVENITDWKNGDFFLDGIDFRYAMRKIARWYDVDIIYDDSFTGNLRSGGWISRKRPLSAVLKSIEASGQAHFKIDKRKVYVSK